jgi:CRISPR-associated protein Cmr5
MLQTRSQRFAATAFKHVSDVATLTGRDKYKAITRNLPVLIRTAGLAQALAFIPSGDEQKKMHQLLITHLSETVGRNLIDAYSKQDLTLQTYIHLTRETLDALVWYKRFAESLLSEVDR